MTSQAAALARYAPLVAAGAFVGTLARAALEQALPTPDGGWPATTFAINVAGALALGALLESLRLAGDDTGWRRRIRLGIGTGVLGGFTTYSTFALEADALLGGGRIALALLYATGSVLAGLAAAALGMILAARIRGHRDRDEDA